MKQILPRFTPFKRVTFHGIVEKNFLYKKIKVSNKEGFLNYIKQLNDGETIKIILERIE